MDLTRISLLANAVGEISEKTISPYIRIKEMLKNINNENKSTFEKTFRKYYGMNSAGLSDEFFQAFFSILYTAKHNGDFPSGRVILEKLYTIKRKKGDKSMQYSFVSKLLNALDEDHPIIDKYVKKFLQIEPPPKNKKENQLQWYEETIFKIKQEYGELIQNGIINKCFEMLDRRLPQFKNIYPLRKLDFLIYSAGKSGIF